MSQQAFAGWGAAIGSDGHIHVYVGMFIGAHDLRLMKGQAAIDG